MSVESYLVKAIYSFKGKNNDELCFKKGDIITVTQKEEGGWWEGTLGETTGWFPSNYVTEYKDASGSVTTSPIRAPSEIQAFRNVVLKDIIDSEKAHVAEMQGLVTNFLEPLEKSDMLSKDEFKQLTGNINEVLQTHEQFLTLLEECATKTGPDQRVGGLFLQWAPKIKGVHQIYCSGHPKAVCILDKYKEQLNTWMENAGAVCPGVLVLTAGLSKPFRRLGKYPAMLQELARHVHEAHPDRGDTHRASVVYKDIASSCAALRRQKELELQVVTGEVRGWPGGELSTLGDVLHMGSVAVGPSHQDRYLVLFPSALLLLSVSKRVSAFVYEGCLPLTGITVCKLEDTDTCKNAFEISGPMIDTILAVCQTRAEADNWVSLLQKHSNTSSPSHEPGQPQSLPHLTRSPSEGALSSINSSRRSLYHVTLPPASYPSASPYYSLTKYFAKLVKKKVITKQMLRKLLHERTWAKAFELTGLPVMRRHKNHIRLRIENDGTIGTETENSDSDESDRDTNSTESFTSSSSTYAEMANYSKISRQNAVDSPRTISSSCNSWDSNYGYVRYFDNTSDMHFDEPQTPLHLAITGDCTRDLFQGISSNIGIYNAMDNEKQLQNTSGRLTNQRPFLPHSESVETSSLEVRPYMACEDLVNIDQNIQIETLGNDDTDFLPTRRSCPNTTRNYTLPKLWKSNEENYRREKIEYDNTLSFDVLQDLDPPSPKKYDRNSFDSIILDPPPMFRNDDNDNMKVINVNLNTNIPFRKHSLNSDKRIRRSMSRSMIDTETLAKNDGSRVQRMSSQSENNQVQRKCECCNRSLCPSPRSSDSGVVGSCNLASPDMQEYSSSGNAGNDSDTQEKIALKDSLTNTSHGTFDSRRKNLTLSEIEAETFEDQCRCTSPFGSTARTSCVTSVTSENSLDVLDSSNTHLTSTFAANPPLSTAQIKRTSIRRNIESYIPEIKLKPKPPPRIYRKPSTHLEIPKNVRHQMPCQWSTLNIAERSKPSRHYHMRIYRENLEEAQIKRESRTNVRRNRDLVDKHVKEPGNYSQLRKTRSRSEDMSKTQKGLAEADTGFVVYRSDLYAHWWMKAKLPITVVTDSGKDNYFVKNNFNVSLV